MIITIYYFVITVIREDQCKKLLHKCHPEAVNEGHGVQITPTSVPLLEQFGVQIRLLCVPSLIICHFLV